MEGGGKRISVHERNCPSPVVCILFTLWHGSWYDCLRVLFRSNFSKKRTLVAVTTGLQMKRNSHSHCRCCNLLTWMLKWKNRHYTVHRRCSGFGNCVFISNEVIVNKSWSLFTLYLSVFHLSVCFSLHFSQLSLHFLILCRPFRFCIGVPVSLHLFFNLSKYFSTLVSVCLPL